MQLDGRSKRKVAWKVSLVSEEEENDPIRDQVNNRFRDYHLVSDHFPLTLRNGTQIKGVVATCSRCRKNISESMFRGEVHPAPDDCFKVTAIGWCIGCSLLSPFLFSVMPDGENFIIKNMEYRGWEELYEKDNVIEWEKARAKIRKRKEKRKIA